MQNPEERLQSEYIETSVIGDIASRLPQHVQLI